MSEAIRVALNDLRLGEAAGEQFAKGRVIFDQDQPFLRDAAFEQGFGHRPGARPEFDDRAGRLRVDIARHRPRKKAAGRRHRPRHFGIVEPALDEPRLVGETFVQRETRRAVAPRTQMLGLQDVSSPLFSFVFTGAHSPERQENVTPRPWLPRADLTRCRDCRRIPSFAR